MMKTTGKTNLTKQKFIVDVANRMVECVENKKGGNFIYHLRKFAYFDKKLLLHDFVAYAKEKQYIQLLEDFVNAYNIDNNLMMGVLFDMNFFENDFKVNRTAHQGFMKITRKHLIKPRH